MGEVRTGFEPGVHGFRFPNSFSTTLLPSISFGPVRTPQIALGGLCGGMTFAALDYYVAGRPIPTHTPDDYPDSGVPPATSRLHDEIFRRHLTSVGFEPADNGIPVPGQSIRVKPRDLYNLLQYPRLRFAPASTLQATLATERKRAVNALAAGTPIPIGLVSAGNLFHSHQVVAVGYDDSGTGMRMFIYDCRTPDVTAVLTATGASCTLETPGQAPEPWRAFFVERYAARTPTYVDLSLVAPAVVTPIDDGQARVRFTVRNSGDADAHLAAIGVRVGDALLSPTEPVGTLAPGGEASFEHDVKVGDTAPQPIYTDASGHQFVLPSST